MKYLLILFTAILMAQPEAVPTNGLNAGSNITRLNGEIVRIEEVQKNASFGKRFGGSMVGALIGGQIGGGVGNDVAGIGGAFLGAEIADKKYGEKLDHIFLVDKNGREYETYVQDHIFRVGDGVQFTMVNGHISAIVLN
jgi:outer membrane lipoprotein SlyB